MVNFMFVTYILGGFFKYLKKVLCDACNPNIVFCKSNTVISSCFSNLVLDV